MEALTYRGWLLYRAAASGSSQLSAEELASLQQRALASLEQAVAADPTYTDARVFRGIIFRDLGRLDEARAELDQVKADQLPDFMRPMVDQLRSSVQTTAGGTAPR